MMMGIHGLWWCLPLLLLGAVTFLVWRPTYSLLDGSREAERAARRLYAEGEIDEPELRERLAALRR